MDMRRGVESQNISEERERECFEITETYMTGLRVMKMIAMRLSFVAATIIK